MKRQTMVVAPIIAALVKAEDRIGANRVWQAINDLQKKFLTEHFIHRDKLGNFRPEELRSWISESADELNKILTEEGFDIQLSEFPSGQFGVLSILDVLVDWLVEGRQIEIFSGGKKYAGVEMKRGELTEDGPKLIFEAFRVSEHSHPIACVHTKSGDRVFMTIAGKEVEGFDLVDAIDEIRKLQFEIDYFEKLEFPMIDYCQTIDISWLLGMTTNDLIGSSWDISQAIQQTKFKMNHQGARVKSAVAMAIRMLSINIPKVLRIDKPFWFWTEREGLEIPIIYGYFDTGDWKNPGSLEM